jgi:hypothetical protein
LMPSSSWAANKLLVGWVTAAVLAICAMACSGVAAVSAAAADLGT